MDLRRRVIAIVVFASFICAAPLDAARQRETSPPVRTLTGQWRGKLAADDERKTDLVLDLNRLSGRWVGQCDLQEFGVEDYPVDVVLDGDHVTLSFTAAQIDFEGVLSRAGDRLVGIANTRGHSDSLVLRRSGAPHLSKEFLALERVAEDSTRVEALSADAAQLRRQFNADRGYTRLLMLLSPT
jgi:hypothetical protein